MTDLIERLRAGTGGGKHWMDLHTESADTIEAQAERIRVLREALEVARNGLAWYIDMHPDEADDSDAETMAQIIAALEATR